MRDHAQYELARVVLGCVDDGRQNPSERATLRRTTQRAAQIEVTVQRAHCVTVALALAACHHPPPHHPGEEYLKTMRFEGNHAISSGDLREGLALRRAQQRGGAPDPYLVSVDAERVKGEYVRAGYLEVEVHPTVERHGDAATVTYRIEEGPRATTRVEITGLPDDLDLPIAKVRDKLPLDDGRPFSYAPYDAAKQQLIEVVQDAGYAYARLDSYVTVDRMHHQAIVQLDYTPGPKCKFGKIDIEGAPPTLRDAVRARLAFDPGDTFSTKVLAESQRNIYAMQRFSTVRVMPDKTGSDTVDVKITVAQSSPHEITLGGGVGADPLTYEVRGRVGYSVLGWPWPLTNFAIDTRPAYADLRDGSGWEPRIRALAKLTRLDLFAPFITGTVEGGYNYLAVEAYTSYGPLVRLGLQTPLGVRQLQLRVGWQLESVDFRQISPLVDPLTRHELGLDHGERVGEYSQALALDLRDNPVEPTLGAYAEVRATEGTKYAAGALDFFQVAPDLRGYVPLGDRLVLAARARAGTFYGDIPVIERYFEGGATSQRGFSERRLAPTLIGYVGTQLRSVPIGGGGMFISSAELRARLGTVKGMGLGGVVFLDGGDVRERFSDIDFYNLHWAAGVGLRLFTIIGAVRADLGYRLDRTGPMEPEPNSHLAFHITIGEAY